MRPGTDVRHGRWPVTTANGRGKEAATPFLFWLPYIILGGLMDCDRPRPATAPRRARGSAPEARRPAADRSSSVT